MTEDRLTFIALNVSDLRRSLAFYRDVIGVPLHEASHDAELDDRWYGGDHAAISWTVVIASFRKSVMNPGEEVPGFLIRMETL